MVQLGQPRPPPAAREPPGAGPAQRLADVAPADAAQRVRVARGREQRGRADQDVAAELAREVDAEERQRADRAPGRSGRAPAPRAPAAAAGRRRGTGRCAGRGPRRPSARAGPTTRPRRTRRTRRPPRRARGAARSRRPRTATPVHAGVADHLAAGGADVVGERGGDRGEVDDRRLRGVERGDAGRVRLDRSRSPAASTRRRPGTPLAAPRRASSSSAGQLARVERDDHLAAALVGDPALLAVAPPARARPRRTAAPSATPARSRCRRGRRRSCGPSGGRRAPARARARRRGAPRRGARARARRRARGSLRRPPRCRPRSWRESVATR